MSLFTQPIRIAGLLGPLRAPGLGFHSVFQGFLGFQDSTVTEQLN